MGHAISHSTNSGFVLPPSALNEPSGSILARQLSGMYLLTSCPGVPVFFASLLVGVGQKANSFFGSRAGSPAHSLRTVSFSFSSSSEYRGSCILGK